MASIGRLRQIAVKPGDTLVDIKLGEELRKSVNEERLLFGKEPRSDDEWAAGRR